MGFLCDIFGNSNISRDIKILFWQLNLQDWNLRFATTPENLKYDSFSLIYSTLNEKWAVSPTLESKVARLDFYLLSQCYKRKVCDLDAEKRMETSVFEMNPDRTLCDFLLQSCKIYFYFVAFFISPKKNSKKEIQIHKHLENSKRRAIERKKRLKASA